MLNQNIVAYSTSTDIKVAIADIKEQLSNVKEIKAVMFAAASSYNQNELAKAANEAFPNICTFGMTSHAVGTIGKITEKSFIAATALTDELIEDCKIVALKTVSTITMDDANKFFSEYYDEPLAKMDPKKYFGICMTTYKPRREDFTLRKLAEITEVVFTGGVASSSGDALADTCVFLNGVSYRDGIILALCKANRAFNFYTITPVRKIGKKCIATKSDIDKGILYELDGKPAAEVYAETMKVPVSKIMRWRDEFYMYEGITPYRFAVELGDGLYIRAINSVNEDKSLNLFAGIDEGATVNFCTAQDTITYFNNCVVDIRNERTSISFVLAFHCRLIFNEVKRMNALATYGELISRSQTMGLFCTGEFYKRANYYSVAMLIFE